MVAQNPPLYHNLVRQTEVFVKCFDARWVGQVVCSIFLLLMPFSLSTTAQVNHYYVSNSGSDSNSGTSLSSAWATIGHALSAFTLGSNGAVIHVQAGNYGTG